MSQLFDNSQKNDALLLLDVYVSKDCWSCRETRRIVADTKPIYPDVYIRLIELDEDSDGWPPHIFAVPTYILSGKVISLGNPTRKGLQTKLKLALEGKKVTAASDGER